MQLENKSRSTCLMYTTFALCLSIGTAVVVSKLENLALVLPFCILVLTALVMFPSFILGVYGADLHKVLLDVSPNLWGQPLLFQTYTGLSDMIMASVALGSLLIYTLRGKVRWRAWVGNTPVVSQLMLAILLVISFTFCEWDSWSRWRLLGFLGGNLLLLLMGAAVCHGAIHLRRIWAIWLVMSSILGLGGIWLLSLGHTWGDARNALINLSNIRLGYVCAVAIIFLITTYRPGQGAQRKFFRFIGLGLFGIGIVTSGSKAAFIFILFTLLLFGTVGVYVRGKHGFRLLALTTLSVVVLIGTLVYLGYSGLFEIEWVVGVSAYEKGIASRVDLTRYYLNQGLSAPVFGIGFSKAWSLGPGWSPHNALVEIFVQSGVLGLALFLIFVVGTLATGWHALNYSQVDSGLHRLIAGTYFSFVFSLMMLVAVGDVVSNRVCWLLAGMLLGVGDQYKKSFVVQRRTDSLASN